MFPEITFPSQPKYSEPFLGDLPLPPQSNGVLPFNTCYHLLSELSVALWPL